MKSLLQNTGYCFILVMLVAPSAATQRSAGIAALPASAYVLGPDHQLVIRAVAAPEASVSTSSIGTAAQIRATALAQTAADQRPLPLMGGWNAATIWNAGTPTEGFSPSYQMGLIDEGSHILPWFNMPLRTDSPTAPAWVNYYASAIQKSALLGLPISFVGPQWEQLLYTLPEFLNLPPAENPNVVTDGVIVPELSPFGAVSPWYQAGFILTSCPTVMQLQEWYPSPPLIMFISNNEAQKLAWTDVEQDDRYLQAYGPAQDDAFKRKVVGDGWITRYRALQSGMRDGLVSSAWKANVQFIGFGAFGPSYLGRWGGWLDYSLYLPQRFDPSPLQWDGGSPPFYLNSWEPITDFTVWSPQVESMNWIFMLNDTPQMNRNFWFEFSIWDGHDPGAADDKWAWYQSIGQTFTPARYAAMAQFGMWLLTPRCVREYRNWAEPRADVQPFFDALRGAVDVVHNDPVLRRFWSEGWLVANPSATHPYQSDIPPELQRADRWFNLTTDHDPPRPWFLDTQLPVYALARVLGSAPARQWLLYAYSPTGQLPSVGITIPGYGAVRVNLSEQGSFWVIRESNHSVSQLSLPSLNR
jgi:hypothetical protein